MVDKNRKKRIEELIQRELGMLLLRYKKHELFAKISITAVDVSPDLSTCKVFFSVFDEKRAAEAAEVLKGETGFLRKSLAHGINLRKTPKLNFVYDESIVRSRKILDLINSANAKDEKGNQL